VTEKQVPVALTIAGSDPSGGAGIQSDLKTFSRLRVYGMAVIAALTAQNTTGVWSVEGIDSEFLAKQLDAVLSDIPPGAAKTGMLLTKEAVEIVAQKVRQYRLMNFVVDPVMVSTSGSILLNSDAMLSFRRTLLPLAFLITPNLAEAQALTGKTVETVEEMEQAALEIHGLGAMNVLIKGGHGKGDEATDVFFDGKDFVHFRSPRIRTSHTHGTGCVLSAAITAHLALGNQVQDAVKLGKNFVSEAIRNGLAIGRGTGPCDPLSLSV